MNLCNKQVYSSSAQCDELTVGFHGLHFTWKPPSLSATEFRDQKTKSSATKTTLLLVVLYTMAAPSTWSCRTAYTVQVIFIKEGHVNNEIDARVIPQRVDYLTGDSMTAEIISVLLPFRGQVDLVPIVLEKRLLTGIATHWTRMANVGNKNKNHHHPATRFLVGFIIEQCQVTDHDYEFLLRAHTGREIAKETKGEKTICVKQPLWDWRRLNLAMTRRFQNSCWPWEPVNVFDVSVFSSTRLFRTFMTKIWILAPKIRQQCSLRNLWRILVIKIQFL